MIQAGLDVVTNYMSILVETVLLVALYYGFKVISNMKDDLEYSTTRIFLSPRAVRGLKVLMAVLVSFAVFNLVTVLALGVELRELFLRINIAFLFSGWLYFLWTMADITNKTSN